MDDATRAEAQKKLATFDPRIGYPSKWRDYSALAIEHGQRSSRTCATAASSTGSASVARLEQPVDRDEWGMNPQTVNAYYNPLDQPDHLPGRDPAAAVLRRQRRSGGELRRASAR